MFELLDIVTGERLCGNDVINNMVCGCGVFKTGWILRHKDTEIVIVSSDMLTANLRRTLARLWS